VLVDELIHDSLACLIKFGNGLPYSYSPSVAMVFMRCLLDSGARVTGLSAFNLLTPNDTEIGNADFVEIAAEPLYVAAMAGEVEMIQLLLQYGADPATPASDGTTPFFVACQYGHLKKTRRATFFQLLPRGGRAHSRVKHSPDATTWILRRDRIGPRKTQLGGNSADGPKQTRLQRRKIRERRSSTICG
jgi:ankyrin repeat protein